MIEPIDDILDNNRVVTSSCVPEENGLKRANNIIQNGRNSVGDNLCDNLINGIA